jgi:flagellar motor protein MotB
LALAGLLLSLHSTPGDTKGLGDQVGTVMIYRDNVGYEEIVLPVAWAADHPSVHSASRAEPASLHESDVLTGAELGRRLDVHGRVQVYGIVFDARGEIERSSKGVLEEIAALLGRRPYFKLHVVGHSDNIGSLAANREISKRRAHAVCVALVTEHAISRDRLTANGMGPLAPLTSNSTEAGRARNRRIELVVQ